MNGWLMVWPQAIGRAESSHERSWNSSGTNRSRGTFSIAPSTLGSVTPCERRARISLAMRVSGVSGASLIRRSSSLLVGETGRDAAEHGLEVVQGRPVGEVDVQGRDRD